MESNKSFFSFNETENFKDASKNSTLELDQPLYLRVPKWCTLVSQIFIIITVVLGVVDNLVLLAVFKKDKKKSSTKIYIIWLSMANLVALVFTGPVEAIRFTTLWNIIGSEWLCKMHIYIQYNAFPISAILIFCIGLDRFLMVYKPHSTQTRLDISKVLSPVLCVVSSLVFIPAIFMAYQDNRGQCQVDRDAIVIAKVAYLTLNVIMIGSFIPLCFFYIKIALYIKNQAKVGQQGTANVYSTEIGTKEVASTNAERRASANFAKVTAFSNKACSSIGQSSVTRGQLSTSDQDQSRKEKSRRRTTAAMALITVVFFLTTILPLIAVYFLRLPDHASVGVDILMFLAFKLPFLNYATNAILYTFSSSDFRQNAMEVLQDARAAFNRLF